MIRYTDSGDPSKSHLICYCDECKTRATFPEEADLVREGWEFVRPNRLLCPRCRND